MTTPRAGADLEYQELNGTDLRAADLRGARLRGTRMQDVDLREADLRGADLRGVLAMWSSTSLRGAQLDGCDLRDADFSGVDARGVSLQDANLEGSRWDDADLQEANLARVRTGWQSIWLADLAGGRDRRQPASFDDARLAGAVLTGADLPGVSLRRADLGSVCAANAVLTGAQLAGANLQDANLGGVDLVDAELRDAILARATLRDAALLGARLMGTQLAGAVLHGVRLGATVVHRLAPGHPAAADFVVHLAPSITDPTAPSQIVENERRRGVATDGPAEPETTGLTCLLVGETAFAVDVKEAHKALSARGVQVYQATPDCLQSPAGPVVTARASAAHPFAVAVVPHRAQEPSWLADLRRVVLDKPVWTPKFLITITAATASRSREQTVCVHGSIPPSLRTLVDDTVGALGAAPVGNQAEQGAP